MFTKQGKSFRSFDRPLHYEKCTGSFVYMALEIRFTRDMTLSDGLAELIIGRPR